MSNRAIGLQNVIHWATFKPNFGLNTDNVTTENDDA